MTALLVSVRSAAEAHTALAGGAALIDVKEPARGSLGRADDAVIRAVVAAVGGRVPVSAALGEWGEDIGDFPDADVTYVKWGLAGCARSEPERQARHTLEPSLGARAPTRAHRLDWRAGLNRHLRERRRPQIVLTAYADWQCARAPALEEVFAIASAHPGSVMLVDTHCKDASNPLGKERPTLLDWLPAPWIVDLCARCREARVHIALAGSLGAADIEALADARPDWFAVRGAVCDGDRHGTVAIEKVRQLAALVMAIPAS